MVAAGGIHRKNHKRPWIKKPPPSESTFLWKRPTTKPMQRAEVSNQRKCVMSMFCVLLVGRLWALPKVMLRLDPGTPLLRTVGPSARCPTSPTTGLHQQGQNIIVMTPNEIHTDIIVGQGGCKGLCFVEETKTCCWGGGSHIAGFSKDRVGPKRVWGQEGGAGETG